MMVLPTPPAKADETVLKTLCKRPEWAPHYALWLAAYRHYHAVGGDPARVPVTVFATDVADAQRQLYELRKRNGPLKRLRQTQTTYCPTCGSGTAGGLDHSLPKNPYAEFSIFRANLVPACTHCNSSAKSNTVPSLPGERFLHPYFDAFLDDPIWWVRIRVAHGAATFHPRPLASLDRVKRRIVRFHLRHVFAWPFTNSMNANWANLMSLLRDRLGLGVVPTEAMIAAEVVKLLRDCETMEGINAWRTAFYRGVVGDPAIIAYLAIHV